MTGSLKVQTQDRRGGPRAISSMSAVTCWSPKDCSTGKWERPIFAITERINDMDLIYILVHLIIRWQQGGSRKEDERRTEGDPASTVPLLPRLMGPEHRGRSEMGPGDKVHGHDKPGAVSSQELQHSNMG